MASTHIARISAGGVNDRRIAHSLYGYCTTAAATVMKQVSLYTGSNTDTDESWSNQDLFHGLTIKVRFQYTNSASNPTLNVNNTGALPIVRYGTTRVGTNSINSWAANQVVTFTYDSLLFTGGCWVIDYGYRTGNDNTIGYQIRTNSMSLPVSSNLYRHRILFTSADGTHFVPANNSNSTSTTTKKAVNQEKIDPFGQIVVYATTTTVAAENRPGPTYLWHQYTVSFGYSFNTTGGDLTLTPWTPVYIKCTPQSDGSAIIDPETPYVQELPFEKDGKIYIFFGVAYNAGAVQMFINHPVYYHDGNKIKLWTGESKDYSSYIENNIVENIAIFSDGAEDAPVKELNTNIIAIKGINTISINKFGKNVLNITPQEKLKDDETVESSITSWHSNRINVNQNIQATLTLQYIGTYTNGSIDIVCYNKSGNIISNSTLINTSNEIDIPYSTTFSFPEETDHFYICGEMTGNGGTSISTALIQLEFGSIYTDYEEINHTIYSIPIPSEVGTFYGGILNIITGELTVNMTGIDMGSLTWEESSTLTGRYYANLPDNSQTPYSEGDYNALCEEYPRWTVTSIALQPDNTFYVNSSRFSSTKKVVVRDTSVASAADLKTKLSGKNLIYSLYNWQYYDISIPIQVTTFLGKNNIWIDNGNIEITYRANLNKYINNKFIEITPDKTLSQLGIAADAKVVGDKINSLSNNYNDILNSAYIENEISGGLASFSDGANNIPVKSLIVDIKSIQDGINDPAPDNIRPINAWTGVKIVLNEKNLINKNIEYINGQVIDTHGKNSSNSSYRYTKPFIGVKPSTTYSVRCEKTTSISTAFTIVFYDSNKQFISRGTAISSTSNTGILYGNFTTPTNCKYIKFNIANFNINNIQIEEGNTSTDYSEPTVYNINFSLEAGTVYGGRLNVTTGELTVDRGIYTFDGIDSIKTVGTTSTNAQYISSQTRSCVNNDLTLKSNQYSTVVTSAPDASKVPSIRATVSTLYVFDNRFTDLETAASLVAANPIQIEYALPSPITYQLNPTEITTLLGRNNIWADTGDIEIVYRADTKKYIENLTTPDNDMIADANIPSGKYFMINNALYLSTAAITSGEAIVPGTNCTLTNLAEALNALNV